MIHATTPKSMLLMVCCFFYAFAHAQWNTNTAINTLVAAQQTEDVKCVRGSDGSTYIAFWHNVAAPQYYELRLQKLDTNGVQLFGSNGMLVDGTTAMSSYIVTWDMVINDSNQIFLGFTGTGGNNDAVVHKISPTGTKLWGANGLTIGSGYDVKILPLSNGQIIVSYLPGTQAVIRKYSATGTAMWAGPITINPVNTGSRTVTGEMVEISGNKFEYIYFEQASFSPWGLPYVRCFGFGGGSLWPASALTNGVYTQTNKRHSVAKNQDTVYFGYAGSVGLNIQGYVQRINPNGTLPWGINAVDFATQSSMYERDVRIAIEENTFALWAIAEFTQSNQANVGEYVQKFNKSTGARLLGANAQVVFPVGTLDRSHHGELRLVGGKPIFLVTDGVSNGVFPKDIWLIRLDTSGVLNPATGILPVATNPNGIKSRIQLAEIVENDAVSVWTENRGTAQPYAHNISLTPCNTPISSFYATSSGLSVDFTSTGTSTDSVFWDFGDGSSISDTATVVSHTYVLPGTFTVCRIAFSTCGNDTACQTITVCLPISAQFSYSVFADSVSFTASWNAGDSLFWDFGDGTSLSVVGATVWHQFLANGTYTVKLIAFNSCGSDTSSQTIVISGIGVVDILPNKATVNVWPNPALNHINIAIPPQRLTAHACITVFDLSGKQLMVKRFDELNQKQIKQLDISTLPAGTYLLCASWIEKPVRFVVNR